MPDLSQANKTKTPGVKYEFPVASNQNQTSNENVENNNTNDLTSVPLEDLMSKLKNL